MSDEKKEAASLKLTNVSVKYAKVQRPGKAYEDTAPDEWSVNMYVSKEDRDALMAHGVEPKTDKEGNEYFIAKRSTKTKAGEDAKKPPVVDGAKQPFTDDIGNGSLCNIAVTLFPWDRKGKKGVKVYLNAVQVVKHVPYSGTGVESFDVVDNTDHVADF